MLSLGSKLSETANIIMDEIHHKKKLDIDESLVEIGDKSSITDGLSKDESYKLYDSFTL